MSRILLSAYACEPGKGSEPEVGWLWATELARAGHETWVITREANRATLEAELQSHPRPGLHFAYCDLSPRVRSWKRSSGDVYWYYALWQWRAFRVAQQLVRQVRFDCVQHVTFVGLRAPSFMGMLGLPFLLGPVSGGECVPATLREGMPYRAKLREVIRDLANRAIGIDPVMRNAFRKAERILIATEASRQLVPRKYRSKCEVQLGVGLGREYLGWTRAASRRHFGPLRLLYAGRLLEWKGLDLALAAVKQALDSGNRVEFTVVGNGPAEPRLRKLACKLGLEDEVRWQKWIPHSELDRLFYQHDVLLFPSLRDSGGMVLLEALAHGIPVICTDLGGPGAIVHTRCGRVVPAAGCGRKEIVTELAKAVAELNRDRVLLAKLSRGARSRAWEFDFQSVAARVHPIPIEEDVLFTSPAMPA